jgi:hypothetical protein
MSTPSYQPDLAAKAPCERELEKQLALVTEAIANCFAEMQTEDRTYLGDKRNTESRIAAELLSLSRESALALAKIRKRYQQVAIMAQQSVALAGAGEAAAPQGARA